MHDKLKQIRVQIDEVDQKLLEAIEKRLELVHQVGELKLEAGIPVCDPLREQQMIQSLRQKAIAKSISPDLIEDIIRRLMRQSYVNESEKGFYRINKEGGDIVIVGGLGKMGAMFAKTFRRSGYHVHLLDKDDDITDPNHYSNASLVLISVPIHLTETIIEQLPELPRDCVLADLTSVKTKPLMKMLAKHEGPVVGLHPMFGPATPSMVRQTIILCHGRDSERYEWLVKQMQLWGAELVVSDAQNHDKQMSIIQALRHFTSFVYGFFLMQEGADIEELLLFSSPIYRLELSLVGRLFAQSAELYADIITSSNANLNIIQRYCGMFDLMTEILLNKDKKAFIKAFEKAGRYFSPHASFLMDSTDHLLEVKTKQSKNGSN